LKIERDNPTHWVYAAAFAITLVLVVILRPFHRRRGRPLVLLYGHKLNGNLLALHRGLEETELDFAYLTMDARYHRSLRAEGIPNLLAYSWTGFTSLLRAWCVVTDHGPQLMAWLPLLTDLVFVDVWHGIPFKGWTASDFKQLHRYDEIWVPSDLLNQIYVDRLGFDRSQVRTTGYGRTDALVRRTVDAEKVKADLGLGERRVVLFAPTWTHGTNRSEIPFGLDVREFLSSMGGVARERGAVCVVRAHLNTRMEVEEGEGLRFVSASDYSDTESLLQVTDILVCDWSSIAFDFLLLDRPTIFLEVPAPFRQGFTLDPSYRFGSIAQSHQELMELIAEYLDNSDRYIDRVGDKPDQVKSAVYGQMADGRSTDRYLNALRELLDQ
jgi:CDP-glycerol glycerophosphotransferase